MASLATFIAGWWVIAETAQLTILGLSAVLRKFFAVLVSAFGRSGARAIYRRDQRCWKSISKAMDGTSHNKLSKNYLDSLGVFSFRNKDWLNVNFHSGVSATHIGFFEPEETERAWKAYNSQLALAGTTWSRNITAQQKAIRNMKRIGSHLIAADDICDEAGFLKRPLRIPDDPPVGMHNYTLKKTIDRIVSACALAAAAPLLIAIYTLVACQMNDRPLVKLRRKAWHGRSVLTSSFVTRVDRRSRRKETKISLVFSRIDVANFVYRCGISGLPQLVDVVRGDLSLVGPNPSNVTVSQIDSAGELVVSEMATRRHVQPGLLDFAFSQSDFGPRSAHQSDGRRNRLNVAYLTAMTPWFDVKCAARTFALLLQRPT